MISNCCSMALSNTLTCPFTFFVIQNPGNGRDRDLAFLGDILDRHSLAHSNSSIGLSFYENVLQTLYIYFNRKSPYCQSLIIKLPYFTKYYLRFYQYCTKAYLCSTKRPACRTLAPERGRLSGHISLAQSAHPPEGLIS